MDRTGVAIGDAADTQHSRALTEFTPVSQVTPSTFGTPLVLLVSFDGFRWDYLDRTDTPHFDSFVREGVKAKYIFDTFASKTFPNHYSIATGLYQESHGIVGNVMYDPFSGANFSLSVKQNPVWWNDGEPIWVTNQKQGGHSALIMYPGMEVKIRGQYATYRLPEYNSTFPFKERIDMITNFFANDSVNLGLLYFHEPDHSGHVLGPDSPGMDAVLQMCDETLGYLMEQLRNAGLDDRVDVIITSDHGMTPVSSNNFVQLDDFVDPSLYHYTNNNPVFGIWPFKESDVEVIYSKLQGVGPNVNAYLKEEIPARYHYRAHPHIAPIVLVAKEGWAIHRGNDTSRSYYLGNHGYNNSLMSMHPIFIARGPSFRRGLVVEPFENVNIYPLICQILGLEPAPNNGSLGNVQDLLRYSGVVKKSTTPETFTTESGSNAKPPSSTLSTSTIIGIAIAGAVLIVAVCLLVAMCARQRSYRQPPRQYTPIADTSLDVADDDIDDSGFSSYNYPNTKI
ncbi:bis(5'-adenosyl)-triphosphatase enpp4-like isoform X2 [Acanthaster planci]|uniref:Bis(5'-adenosyl)-triphosphatase enpp4-like isoform X2 n=1 Tax=Acanthaster planci TaxID=133434 RepID=A0A8B7ZQF3_ACAPL|nr:bis(5'-adenosyl)-triphosphatase enpp4-like isoform X2 [Acanthaster planci]